MKLRTTIFAALGILAVHTTSAFAQMTIAVDEAGNHILNGAPAPSGIPGIEPLSGMPCMVFPLFFQPNPGDVVILDTTGVAGDIVRFIPNSAKLYFFSLDDELNSDSLADVAALPPAFASLPQAQAFEQGVEGNDFLPWPAGPGSIGGNPAIPLVQYTFQSDGLIPEPSTFILLGLGSAGVGFVAYKRRKGVA
jgi:PEP-CTERM motif